MKRQPILIPQWRRVRGKRISGVLFEIDPHTAMIRVKRGRRIETVNLQRFGIKPVGIDTREEIPYNDRQIDE